MEEKDKGIMNKIKKVLATTIMAATISGASVDAVAYDGGPSLAEEQFKSEFYKGVPALQFADARIHSIDSAGKVGFGKLCGFAKSRGWNDETLEKEFYDILGKRKAIIDPMFEQEKEKLTQVPISKELLKKYGEMSEEELKGFLKNQNDKLITKDLVSLDTPNDALRINGVDRKISEMDLSKLSNEEKATQVIQTMKQIENNKKLLGIKKGILENDTKYIELKESYEKIKAVNFPEVKKLAPIQQGEINLMYEQAIIESKIMLRDAEIEQQASQLVYENNKQENLQVEEKNSFRNSIKVDTSKLQPVAKKQFENNIEVENNIESEMER